MDGPSYAPVSPQGWAFFYGGLLSTRRKGAFDPAVLPRLRRVEERLRERPEQPLDLAAMASAAHFSRFHFLRLFRQAYGETPRRYLAQMRLERARELLATSDRSVTDICFDVGYESLASFSHAFRRHTGDAPQRYRRRWIVLGGLPAASGGRSGVRVPGCFAAMYGSAIGDKREAAPRG